jgi:hypothetical protein
VSQQYADSMAKLVWPMKNDKITVLALQGSLAGFMKGFHDTGKARFIILTAQHPWGPWKHVMSYGIWGRAGWNMLMANKFTSADGRKMWYNFCGEYKGDLWYYGFQYMPLYLSTGSVDIYEAEQAGLEGTRVAAEYPAFSGAGYATGFAKTGDKVTFALQGVQGSGWHIVRIRYTSPGANGRTLSVYVNGKKARRVTLSLNNKDGKPHECWTDRSDAYYLRHGANAFEIRQDKGDVAAGVLIDCIAVSREEIVEIMHGLLAGGLVIDRAQARPHAHHRRVVERGDAVGCQGDGPGRADSPGLDMVLR